LHIQDHKPTPVIPVDLLTGELQPINRRTTGVNSLKAIIANPN